MVGDTAGKVVSSPRVEPGTQSDLSPMWQCDKINKTWLLQSTLGSQPPWPNGSECKTLIQSSKERVAVTPLRATGMNSLQHLTPVRSPTTCFSSLRMVSMDLLPIYLSGKDEISDDRYRLFRGNIFQREVGSSLLFLICHFNAFST